MIEEWKYKRQQSVRPLALGANASGSREPFPLFIFQIGNLVPTTLIDVRRNFSL